MAVNAKNRGEATRPYDEAWVPSMAHLETESFPLEWDTRLRKPDRNARLDTASRLEIIIASNIEPEIISSDCPAVTLRRQNGTTRVETARQISRKTNRIIENLWK